MTQEAVEKTTNYKTFLRMLNLEDQNEFDRIKGALSGKNFHYQYNKGLDSFIEGFQKIKTFCTKGDADDWKRCLVCGVCFMQDSIAVNTKRLEQVFSKSKSTINQSLKKLGYDGCSKMKQNYTTLFRYIPHLKLDYTEQRQWSIRKYSNTQSNLETTNDIINSPPQNHLISPINPQTETREENHDQVNSQSQEFTINDNNEETCFLDDNYTDFGFEYFNDFNSEPEF